MGIGRVPAILRKKLNLILPRNTAAAHGIAQRSVNFIHVYHFITSFTEIKLQFFDFAKKPNEYVDYGYYIATRFPGQQFLLNIIETI